MSDGRWAMSDERRATNDEQFERRATGRVQKRCRGGVGYVAPKWVGGICGRLVGRHLQQSCCWGCLLPPIQAPYMPFPPLPPPSLLPPLPPLPLPFRLPLPLPPPLPPLLPPPLCVWNVWLESMPPLLPVFEMFD